MEKNVNTKKEFEESSGNIFEDLGLPNPELEDIKAQLSIKIFQIIKQKNLALMQQGEKRLTQSQIGKLLGIKQPEISKLKNGQYSRFSLERLLYFFERLHYNIDIKLSPAKKFHTHQRVVISGLQRKNSLNEYHINQRL